MKKIIFFIYFFFSTVVIFAISDIKLYQNGDFIYQISDNQIFDNEGKLLYNVQNNTLFSAENDDNCGTIIENEDKIIIDYFYFEDYYWHEEYKKSSGFLVYEKSIFGSISEFDEKSGLKTKTSYYAGDFLISYQLFQFENRKLVKTTNYDFNNSLTSYILYE